MRKFGIVVSFDTDNVVIAASGDVDLLTAPTLDAGMGELLDHGERSIVLDLAAVTFLDASGLGIIARVAERLSKSDHRLTLRSPSSMTRQILEITKLRDHVRIEIPPPHERNIDAENRRAVMVGSSPSNELIEAALRRVTDLVGATIDGADGVSITLERAGRLTTVGASNATVMRMDDHQYQTGEGPCLSAAADGHGYHIESLADETRWPAFVPLATEQGIASILSTPLIVAARIVGALNVYSNRARAFGAHQQDLATRFAAQASGILADAGALDELLTERFADALLARQTIARAQGVLMAREGISANQAAAAIHQSARSAGIVVASRAAVIVASTQTAEPQANEGDS